MKAACCTKHKQDIYQSRHPVCTVVQGSKVSCAQLNITLNSQSAAVPQAIRMNLCRHIQIMFKIIVLVQPSPTPHILKIKVELIIKSQLFTTCCANTMGPNLKILSFSQQMSFK